MGSDNKKIITFSFLGAGILFGLIISLLLDVLASMSGTVTRIMDNQAFRHGFPIFAALALFLSLKFKASANVWADEVVSEIKKVVWPSRRNTFGMTAVVCILLVVSGVVVWGFDQVATFVVEKIVQN